MSQVAGRDHAAFASLYRFQAPLLFSLLSQILQDQKEAQDVLKATFLQIWKSAASYDPDRGSVSTWSVIIARRTAIDRVRSRQSFSLASRAASVENLLRSGARGDENADTGVVRDEGREKVREAMRRIDDGQREALLLAFFGGLTQAEIAQHLQAPLGTLKTSIRRGLSTLRRSSRRARSL